MIYTWICIYIPNLYPDNNFNPDFNPNLNPGLMHFSEFSK